MTGRRLASLAALAMLVTASACSASEESSGGSTTVATPATGTGASAEVGGSAEDSGATGATSPFGELVQGTFTATFDGNPSTPEPWRPANWDVTVHSRDVDTLDRLDEMEAMHGPDCGAPPATHRMSSYEQAVFICRNHMMTAIKASGYGMIYLTPDHQLDFSNGVGTVRWDMSTLRTSIRDWPDLWITPYDDNLQLALESFYPDVNGPPKRAVHIAAVDYNDATGFKVEVYDDHKATALNGPTYDGYEDVLEPDAARRDTFELRIGNGRLRFGMPAYDLWWYDGELPDLGWDRGVVTFGHHSYNPTKDCDDCHPNTWHWDNISLSPAVPFTIIRGDRRVVDAERAGAVTFPVPAPEDAHLRFAGLAEAVEFSTDDGSSWRTAERQSQGTSGGEHFVSYWTPIPAGTESVRFRGTDWWGGDWMVRDITIWSPSAPT